MFLVGLKSLRETVGDKGMPTEFLGSYWGDVGVRTLVTNVGGSIKFAYFVFKYKYFSSPSNFE